MRGANIPRFVAIGFITGAAVRLGGVLLDLSGVALGFMNWFSIVAVVFVIGVALIMRVGDRGKWASGSAPPTLVFAVAFAGAYALVSVAAAMFAIAGLDARRPVWLATMAVYSAFALGIVGALWMVRGRLRT